MSDVIADVCDIDWDGTIVKAVESMTGWARAVALVLCCPDSLTTHWFTIMIDGEVQHIGVDRIHSGIPTLP